MAITTNMAPAAIKFDTYGDEQFNGTVTTVMPTTPRAQMAAMDTGHQRQRFWHHRKIRVDATSVR
jgi:hypothetical protein